MPDFVLLGDKSPARPGDGTRVACWKCMAKSDPAWSEWCQCDSKLRTLVCPLCSSCFCQAPFLYKRTFWNNASKTLREDSRRFASASAATPAPEPLPLHEGSEPVRRPRVLVVDDEEPMRSMAVCYIEQAGYEVIALSSPDEALLILNTLEFDLVLSDVLMPRMDGRELCRQIKAIYGDRVRVLLMTSLYSKSQYRTEARHVFKADDLLAKPLRPAQLYAALERYAPVEWRELPGVSPERARLTHNDSGSGMPQS